MAIVFRGIGTGATAGSGSISPTLPTEWQVGDVHMMVIAHRANVSLGITGWTKLVDNVGSNANTFTTVAYRVAQVGDSAPSITGATNVIGAQIAGYGGCNPTTPISVTGTPYTDNTSTTTITTNGITTLVDNEMVLFMAGSRGGGTTSTYSGSPTPIERIDYTGTTVNICLAEFLITGNGTATGNRTAVQSAAGYNVGVQVSLNPLQDGNYLGKFTPTANTKLLLHLDGESQDYSGNNNDGVGTAITYNTSNRKLGRYGAGFNGTTSKIVITDNTSLKPTGNFTLNFWIKATAGAGETGIFQTYSQNTNIAGVRLRLQTNGTITYIIGKNTGTVLNTDYKSINPSSLVSSSIFSMHTLVWDGSNFNTYYNGINSSTTASAFGAAYAATNYVRVGCNNSSGTDILFLTGSMDEIILESTAWSATDVYNYWKSCQSPFASYLPGQ